MLAASAPQNVDLEKMRNDFKTALYKVQYTAMDERDEDLFHEWFTLLDNAIDEGKIAIGSWNKNLWETAPNLGGEVQHES
jgi:hypothetical protein